MTQEELLAAADRYSRVASQWFRDGKDALREKEKEIVAQMELQAPGVKEAVADLTRVVRELRRNQGQIQEHLSRALDCPGGPGGEVDANPPAEVASQTAWRLVDNSINGWLRLKEVFPESEDAILDMLIQLDRLRRAIQQRWPKSGGERP